MLDSGQRRSNLDILNITGEVGGVTTRHLATLLAMLAGCGSRPIRVTAGEECEQYARHRESIEFARTSESGWVRWHPAAQCGPGFMVPALGRTSRRRSFSQLRPSKKDSPMSRYVCILVRLVTQLPEPPAGEPAEPPRCPFSGMPCHAQPSREPVLPGVTVAMAAFYHEHPDAN